MTTTIRKATSYDKVITALNRAGVEYRTEPVSVWVKVDSSKSSWRISSDWRPQGWPGDESADTRTTYSRGWTQWWVRSDGTRVLFGENAFVDFDDKQRFVEAGRVRKTDYISGAPGNELSSVLRFIDRQSPEHQAKVARNVAEINLVHYRREMTKYAQQFRSARSLVRDTLSRTADLVGPELAQQLYDAGLLNAPARASLVSIAHQWAANREGLFASKEVLAS